jgi:CBS domain-containing protein
LTEPNLREQEEHMEKQRHPLFTCCGGKTPVGQLVIHSRMRFHLSQTALAVAVHLMSGKVPGAPVVNDNQELMGFISEFDVLRALEQSRDLSKLTAADIMTKTCVTVTSDTPIDEVARIMEEKHLLMVPVKEDGKVLYSVTRNDLLRAWVGMGLDVKTEG